jgi:hypothetical protein
VTAAALGGREFFVVDAERGEHGELGVVTRERPVRVFGRVL